MEKKFENKLNGNKFKKIKMLTASDYCDEGISPAEEAFFDTAISAALELGAAKTGDYVIGWLDKNEDRKIYLGFYNDYSHDYRLVEITALSTNYLQNEMKITNIFNLD
ncbi:hypothetical protein HM1_0386 [Heliomicrobium modesticaldum Ice1]|uniref:Uncharacterized protein n=2 Tax=Heliomicrobium modesticaldum TaxID=35701 RepID=B0TF22_HELMI|nr:hypothetical protein HM1_0386 [Heliomicrobium modesticaldum Ice1]